MVSISNGPMSWTPIVSAVRDRCNKGIREVRRLRSVLQLNPNHLLSVDLSINNEH